MVFWQNVKMSSTDYELNGRELIVRVPREAGLMKRSYMRIIASEGEKISNDLLIPLEYKRVLSDISQLDRTDKQAQVLYSLMIDRFHNGDTSMISHSIVLMSCLLLTSRVEISKVLQIKYSLASLQIWG